jgi:hypothetical protein
VEDEESGWVRELGRMGTRAARSAHGSVVLHFLQHISKALATH